MAAITVRAVKLAAFSAAAVPLIGYSGRLMAQSKEGNEEIEVSQPIRACDIPMYPVANRSPSPSKGEDSEPNIIQKQITSIRSKGSETYDQVMSGYEVVRDKAQTGFNHSKSLLDYVQTNPGELPRVGLITMAVLGGVVVGYKKSTFRKIVYGTIGGISAAALCYPNFTVDLSSALVEDSKSLWKKNIGWPLEEEKKARNRSKTPSESPSHVMKVLTGDHGQSKPEDNDLYSNRSSSSS